MCHPPASGHGPGAEPGRDRGLPGGGPGVPGGARRGPGGLRLADFSQGGPGDACRPGPELAVALDRLSGPDRRCGGASDDELVGLLGRWAALESWAASGKLGVVAELTRRRARPGRENRAPGGMPSAWEEGLGHEVALGLAVALPTADKLTGLAWELQARLPGVVGLLADGTITQVKAQIIAEELSVLDDEHAAAAEQLIVGELAGKTPGQVGRLAAAAAAEVDPAAARRRRERAERDDARVRLWREQAGTAALAGFGLPADAALSANANIACRARAYKRARLAGSMDQLRVLAYLDILNGVPAADRIARARADTQAQAGNRPRAGDNAAGPDGAGPGGGPADDASGGGAPAGSDLAGNNSGDNEPVTGGEPDDESPDGDPGAHGRDDHGEPGGNTPGGPGPGHGHGDERGSGGGSGQPGAVPEAGEAGPVLAASTNLTIPLATLLGLAGRPGHGHGLGPLDPALARDLAAAAARSPHSTWCITITSPQGYAIGHGCARPARTRHRTGKDPPARGRHGPWSLTVRDDPGPPGGYGSWTLTLPGGRDLTVNLGPVPVHDCDHRHQSPGYQPSDTLRHLVQVRDGQCTFPPCSRHARECDFEHAIPHHQGGRTCACNAGARSRRCHQVKQSRGWTVTQPRPGWHQWTTPSGRSYRQGPWQYPA